MAKKYRYGKTAGGYQITNMFRSKSGRKYIVGKKPAGNGSEYFVGLGYDGRDRTWGQGVYGFRTRQKAINYAKRRAYKR